MEKSMPCLFIRIGKWLAITVLLLLAINSDVHAQTTTTAKAEKKTDRVENHAVALQGGWWHVEAEYRAPLGLFVDLGMPWVLFLTHASGDIWKVPLQTKVGYQFDLTGQWKLRGGLRGVISVERSNPCMLTCATTDVISFLLLEAGGRYKHPSGLVIGVELPVFVLRNFADIFAGKTSSLRTYIPVLFAQLYIGYQLLL